MDKIIAYPNAGGVAIVIPAPDCGLTLEQIAMKDVPQGVPYKFLFRSDIPLDRTFRNAWECDFSSPDGYGNPEGYAEGQK